MDNEQAFKIGDVVKLKSGGPDMTINRDKLGISIKTGAYFDGRYECTWFDGIQMSSGIFNQAGLVKTNSYS